jgi:hypothetical protein
MSRKSVSKMERDIEDRYYAIKVALKALFDQRLTGREREVNSHNWHFLCHDNGDEPTLYQVNAGKFIYDMSAQELADLLEAVQAFSTITCWKVASKTSGRWITSPQRRSAARWRPSTTSRSSRRCTPARRRYSSF